MDEAWTVRRILAWIEGYLRKNGDANPRLSAQWLVSDALGIDRVQLFCDPERPLSVGERATLRDYTRRRGAGEPLQYITGTTDFRFITVHVEPGVLIPRPETEVLVSVALARVKDAQGVQGATTQADGQDATDPSAQDPALLALDLCTGTGCIACSIAHEVAGAQVYATDIEPRAVELCRRNARNLGLDTRIEAIECDIDAGVPQGLLEGFDLVVSNPPYVPTSVLTGLDAEVADFEPTLALDGGEDGLDMYRRILPAAMRALKPGGILAVELFETTLDEAARLAGKVGFQDIRVERDLAGRPRVVSMAKEAKE